MGRELEEAEQTSASAKAAVDAAAVIVRRLRLHLIGVDRMITDDYPSSPPHSPASSCRVLMPARPPSS